MGTERRPRFTRARPAARTAGRPGRGAVARRRPSLPGGGGVPSRSTRRVRLPGWRELAGGNEKAPPRRRPSFDSVSTARFGLFILALALAFTLYVGHVHASQELLTDVQRLRREQLTLNLKYNRLKGAYDQMTSPARIYERARALGLVEGITYGPTIRIEP
ncbi:MAG: hypothetical protein KatS3mg042_1562 [Rhodothermaceae bacterium]|nr:MAG: hypothetical protein KatS3mg042_1562 [Rhodothermaceae bacterium]